MHPITKILTASILILALLSAGCTDTGGGSVDSPTPHKTAEPTQTGEPTATATQETHWYDDKPYFNLGVIEANENLFGEDIEGIINEEARKLGRYDVFNENEQIIFQHLEYPNFDLYKELQPEQARALEEQYGYPESVVMETDYEKNVVAISYDGDKDWTAYFEYNDDAKVEDYIGAKLNPKLYPMLKEIKPQHS